MKRQAYAKKRDANEPEIVAALRKVGAKVLLIDWCDLIVYYKGSLYMLEVKTNKGKLTPDQQKNFIGWPVHIVRDTGAALLAIGALIK